MKIKTDFNSITHGSILLAGAILALVQYFFNRSLWQDEAGLALNIINLNFVELLKPLKGGHVAPILFLQIEKLFSLLLPNSEFGLRLFPLICYYLTLFFFYKILKATWDNPHLVSFSLSLFVFSIVLIRYSSEVKQYMTDVLASTAIFYFIIKKYNSTTAMFLTIGIAGVFAIFLSNIAPIILSSSGIYLIYKFFGSDLTKTKRLILVFSVWGLVFLAYYHFFIHSHPHKSYMINYWTKQGSFLPLNPFEADFGIFIKDKSKEIFNHILPIGKLGLFIFLPLFIIGTIAMIKEKNRGMLFLCIVPVLIHLFLSALKLYPFATRLVLYLSPMIILVIGFGVEYLLHKTTRFRINEKMKLAITLSPVIFFIFLIIRGYPVEVIEIKECLAYLMENKENDDSLYVDTKMANAFKYYQKTKNLDFTSVEFGTQKRKFNDEYLRGLSESNANHWILLSLNEALLADLDKKGISYEKKFASKDASVWCIYY